MSKVWFIVSNSVAFVAKWNHFRSSKDTNMRILPTSSKNGQALPNFFSCQRSYASQERGARIFPVRFSEDMEQQETRSMPPVFQQNAVMAL